MVVDYICQDPRQLGGIALVRDLKKAWISRSVFFSFLIHFGRRQWQPTPVFLPGKSHGWRSLVGYIVHGVSKSWTQMSDFTFTFHFPALEKEMATHSSVLAWRIPGTEKPGGLPSLGSHRVGHDGNHLAAAASALNSISLVDCISSKAPALAGQTCRWWSWIPGLWYFCFFPLSLQPVK